ncbi:hypothetical protein HR060_05150 [Catenovulum sp. SM1970]|uniref:hypothetical protein n=1 Tax=Marinifaba aquimaris TaxID=2741323 RepID=UPI001572BA41|nr:hypothetical protein [Marinifaba aquimaris]NTS76249.1 hypothetical protein [Marinifaba aquimaris]
MVKGFFLIIITLTIINYFYKKIEDKKRIEYFKPGIDFKFGKFSTNEADYREQLPSKFVECLKKGKIENNVSRFEGDEELELWLSNGVGIRFRVYKGEIYSFSYYRIIRYGYKSGINVYYTNCNYSDIFN